MFYCHVCGSTHAKKAYVNELFNIYGKPVMVEQIPAMECARCGEETFDRETTERIRKIVHGDARPLRCLTMEVFSFSPV
ncbi:MAG: YgiT-type zinc finger protein [Candidatus Brocadiae bacterium]|nr:YgiT-type zinc finger protein [Candidatus Brocadiia bacterium]